MARDTYTGFRELKYHEKINRDYRIWASDVGSPITVMAPHGGRIEPRTSYIARAIAGDIFNCYCFEGIREVSNGRLHITSCNFDEPHALRLIARSQTVVTVHACTEKQSRVYLGGRDEKLIGMIAARLKARGIFPERSRSRYPGLNPANICNRGATRKGAQLELSRGLRDDLGQVELLAAAMHAALTDFFSMLGPKSEDKSENKINRRGGRNSCQ
jgi:phage replication-related protein YjqB (UPF0714/DUF867 family)